MTPQEINLREEAKRIIYTSKSYFRTETEILISENAMKSLMLYIEYLEKNQKEL